MDNDFKLDTGDVALLLSPSGEEGCTVTVCLTPEAPDSIIAIVHTLSEIVRNRQDILMRVLEELGKEENNDWTDNIQGNA